MGIVDNLRDLFNTSESLRRSRLGVDVAKWEDSQPWYYRNVLSQCLADGQSLPDKLYGTGKISKKDSQALLRRAKEILALRSIGDMPKAQREHLDQRYPWNKEQRPAGTLLDYFASLKHSYSSLLPIAHRAGNVNLVVSEKGKARVSDIARSHSIWLDPVDAPKELYKYRLRMNDCIAWAYSNGLIPVMMTLTVFHRWHDLARLLRVLRQSWSAFFSGSKHRKRAADVDLQGYIRRLEITINDGDKDFGEGDEPLTNAGWHPHFHAILFVPANRLEMLSAMEEKWRSAWVEIVCKQFAKEFGERIDRSYLPTFRTHGLWFSRIFDGDANSYGKLRPVKDSKYLAKIMGYDPADVYGADKELTSTTLKDSKTAFDLLADEVTAANSDLFCEYAIATKGVAAFTFSQGLEDTVAQYFEKHPFRKPSGSKCPDEKLVATIRHEVYQVLYRNGLVPQLLKIAAQGYETLCAWLKEVFVSLDVPQFCDIPFAMPRPPT